MVSQKDHKYEFIMAKGTAGVQSTQSRVEEEEANKN